MRYLEEELTEKIIGCIIAVHKTLGPGFVESVYRKALIVELHEAGLKVQTEKPIYIIYRGNEVGCHRLDILVEDLVILELKTVDELTKAHYDQIRSYLKATGLQVGILVNFSGSLADYRRVEMIP
jgi:GxxExxY protein